MIYPEDITPDEILEGEVWMQNADYYWYIVARKRDILTVAFGPYWYTFPDEAMRSDWKAEEFLGMLKKFAAHRGRRDAADRTWLKLKPRKWRFWR